MRVSQPSVDQVISRVPAQQWGVVDLDDLRRSGLSKQAVAKRVAAGRLHPLYRGVYAVGHPTISLRGRCLAAVKRADPARSSPTSPRPFSGACSNRSTAFPTSLRLLNAATRRSTPTSAPSSTHDPPRHPGHHPDPDPHPPFLGAAVQDPPPRREPGPQPPPHHPATTHHHPPPRRQEAQTDPRHGCARTVRPREPRPRVAAPRGCLHTARQSRDSATYKIPDFLWPDHDLVLEADSRRYHDNLIARADDADKQAELEALGYTVIRTTWRECTTRPDRMLARVQRELTRVDPPGALLLRSA